MKYERELQYLRDQIRMNQIRFAKSMEQKDERSMQNLAEKSRELINRINRLERGIRSESNSDSDAPERAR